MRQKIVAGNWKLNGSKQLCEEVVAALSQSALLEGSSQCVLFAPFVYLPALLSAFEKSPCIQVGAQNVSQYAQGAYTGEVSAHMLEDVGVGHVLIGHSERRALFNESDAIIGDKLKLAAQYQLKVFLCVGETLEQRQSGLTEQVIQHQLQVVINEPALLKNMVIAYEPVWAIGTGMTATPEQAQSIHAFIRQLLHGVDSNLADTISLLYGGSVNATNAHALFEQPDIDGGLIGGASLKMNEFLEIIKCIKSF